MKTSIYSCIYIGLLLLLVIPLQAQQKRVNPNLQKPNIIKMDPDMISRRPNLKTGYIKLPFRTQISKVHYIVRNGLAVMENDILLGTADEVERLSSITAKPLRTM